MPADKKFTLRPVTEADDEFLLTVYAGTRAEELARVPWSAEQKEAFVRMQYAAQKRHYAAEYPQATHDIICVDGVSVGRLYLSRGAEVFHILDITVLSQHRNSGTGSSLMRELLKEAGKASKPVTIYVENFNPSLRLFTRLGFQKVEDTGLLFLLRWKPQEGT
ncbi:MAG TPA: GNAT family N-acetyltransferase [Candidatus Angelobacter sp.]